MYQACIRAIDESPLGVPSLQKTGDEMRSGISLLGLAVILFLGLAGAAHAGFATNTPEPASMTLLAVGAGAVALVKFRKRK